MGSNNLKRIENPRSLKLPACFDLYFLRGLATRGTHLLNLLHYPEGLLRHFAEHKMLAVEPVGLDGTKEELRAVRAWASVGHGEDSFSRVLELEVFVFEFVPVN